MPWENVQDLGNNLIPWDYDRSTELSAYPQNVCFSITGTPELNEDVILISLIIEVIMDKESCKE